MSWKDVPIPTRMQSLQRDVRGFPIPYIIMRDKDDKPAFTVNDTRKWFEVVAKKKCPICNQELGEDAWIIGGPMSALHPHGAFIDSPQHYECGSYALQVCPYLVFTQYAKKAGQIQKIAARFKETNIFFDPTVSLDRVPLFVFARVSGFWVNVVSHVEHYIKPNKPYPEVEFWKEGAKMELSAAIEILKTIPDIDIKQALGKTLW